MDIGNCRSDSVTMVVMKDCTIAFAKRSIGDFNVQIELKVSYNYNETPIDSVECGIGMWGTIG
jgi:hypothetical protein